MKRRDFAKSGVAFGLAALAAPLAAPSIVRAQSLTPVKFSADFALQGNHSVFTLGIERGYFTRENLAVKMDRGYGSGDTIVKVASGAYDIGFADINAAVKFNAANPDKRVIAVYQGFDRTLASIITLAKSGIKTPADLIGKTLGAPENDAGRLLFPVFAAKNSIPLDKINWKSIAPNLRETILVQGQVDAITGFMTTSIFNMLAAGVPREQIVTLPYAKNGLDLYGNAVIVREDFLTAHPDIVAGFVRATIAGTKDAIKDRDAAMKSVLAYDPLFDLKLEAARFDMALTEAILTPYVMKNGFGSVDPARMQLTISANSEAYGITNPISLDQLYTTKFLPPQSDRMPQA
jgi:NitT/TauT family transport system substrate-binding protein